MAGIDVYTFHEEEAIPKPEDRAFLTYIADKTEGIIDEEHIITKPEELRSHSDILLNKDIQKSCQRYFTEDAWLCVLNTLKQLQELSKDEEGIINTTKEDGKINTTKEDGKDLPKNIQLNPAEKDAEEDDKYEETKKAMGYNYWSMKLVGNDMYVSLDGHELDMYLKVKGIEKTFGKVYDVELFTALLIKVNFKEDFIIVGLHDFSAASNEFSKSLPSTAKKEEFLASLKQKSYSQTQGYSINQADQEDRSPLQADQEDGSPLQADQEDRRPLQADQEDRRPLQPDQMVGLSEAGNDTQDVQGKSGVNDQEKNSFIEVANKKVIGTFEMPIEQLDFSSDSHSIRKIEPSHCREIITKMKISFLNGDVVSLPDAIGMVPSLVTSEDIKSGKEKVEIIDGNHTLFALRELHEEFPSEKCFESRKVIIYQDLSRSEVFTMALLGNEKAGTVQYTKPIDKLMIMRKVLDENFNGKFSSDFQDHVYKIFNAVCPDNPKEQERRRKNLQSIIRLSTMDSSLLSKVETINVLKPGHSPYVYRDLGSLTVIQANEILQQILDIYQKEKKLNLKEISRMAKERLIKDPPNPTDDLAFQRIRQIVKSKSRKKEESLDQNAESSGTNETVVDLTQATNKSVQMEASHDNLQKDNERLNGIVEDVNRRVQQSEAENKGLNEQVVTLNKRIIHLEEENKNLTADIERIRVDFTRMKEQNEKLLEEKGYLKAEKTALEKHCSMLKEKEEEYKNQHTNEDLNLNGKERETRKRCIKKPPMVDFMCEPAKKKACSSKQHSQESVLPFPLPTTSVEAPPPVENTIEGKSNDCHIVDWNGKVFLSLKTYEKSYIFCKRQIGHMTGDQFIFNENKDSYVLNRKDIQGDQEGFIICCVKCNVDDNKICLLKPASTLKDRILNYMKDEGPKDEGPKDGGSKDEGPKDEGSTENNKHDKADDTSK